MTQDQWMQETKVQILYMFTGFPVKLIIPWCLNEFLKAFFWI